MSAQVPDTLPPSGPVRLNGWKDIAGYLNRGVRTVQRWEKEFGLPIRRLGTGRGEGVFAFANEIDAWQATAQADRARSDSQSASTEGSAPPAPDPRPVTAGTSERWLRMAVVAMAVALTLTVAWAAWSTWRAFGRPRQDPAARAKAGPPASWRVEGNALVVVDASGRTCWTSPLPALVDASFYAAQPKGGMGGVGDIDGDGRREVWVVLSPANGDGAHASLQAFDEDGTPRWTYQHNGRATFGSVAFSGPWVVHRTFLTEAPEDPSRQALWVSSRDGSEFPSLLVRLDIATGKPVNGPYWNNGWVNSVALLRGPDGPRLIVGGTNNEKVAPGVVLLDAANISGSTPAELFKYRCTSCPAGDPLAVAVFPKPRRFAACAGGGGVDMVAVGGQSSGVVATATYAFARSGSAATAVFRLDASLRPLRADPADNYMPTYEQLVRDREIPVFGPLPADPAAELLPLVRWDRAARHFGPAPLALRVK
jgi:hypothetical protein